MNEQQSTLVPAGDEVEQAVRKERRRYDKLKNAVLANLQFWTNQLTSLCSTMELCTDALDEQSERQAKYSLSTFTPAVERIATDIDDFVEQIEKGVTWP